MKFGITALAVVISAFFTLPIAHAEWLGKEDKDIHQQHRAMQEAGEQGDATFVDVTLHDEELLNREGKKVKFVSDVIGDRLAAITFIYTNCTTICPVYQAIFADLQGLLGDRLGKEVVLITMSIDPTRDIPPRMKVEAQKWNARAEWVHLTGKKSVMDRVLQGLDAYFPDFTLHPPMALVGDGKSNRWKRYNGFPKPEELLSMLDEFKMAREGGHHHGKAETRKQKTGESHEMHHNIHHGGEQEKEQGKHHEMHQGGEHENHHVGHDESKVESSEQRAELTGADGSSSRSPEEPKIRKDRKTGSGEQKATVGKTSKEEKARDYFTDLPVINQDGKKLRFYSDVLKDRVVLITMYYTDCGLACPVTMKKLKEVEAVLGDRVGKDIYFVGLSVDSGNDSPEMVKEFLEEYDCYKKGWIFLTGEKRALDHIIYKLGQYRPDIEYHSTMMIAGNVKTGHWAKVNPTYPPPAIAAKLKSLAEGS